MDIAAHIVVPDAAEASAWYAKAFDARELSRIPLPGGKVMTIELAFGDSVVHVGSEFPDMGIVSPLTIGGTATVLQINTDDADGLWRRRGRSGGRAAARARRRVLGRAPRPARRPVRSPLEHRPTDPRRVPRRDRRRCRPDLRQRLTLSAAGPGGGRLCAMSIPRVRDFHEDDFDQVVRVWEES